MAISVVNPVDPALKRTGQILFKPFNIGKWFTLGFCAFLAHLGEGGGGFNFPTNWGGGSGGGPGGGTSGQEILDWIKANVALVVLIIAAIFIFSFAIGLVLMWLRSRGKFMFLHGVATNTADVVRPWKEFRVEGNSLFLLMIVWSLILTAIGLAIVGLAVGIAWPDISARHFGAAAITAIIVGGLVFIAFLIAASFVGMLFECLLIPTMYLHRLRAMEGWRVVRSQLLAGHVGTLVLFYLFQILIGIAIATIALVATCLTCCIAALPYIGTVILLPLFVFMRAYSLAFVEQYGPEWRIFVNADGLRCTRCGYDLRGLPPAGACPECGQSYLTPGAPPPGAPPTSRPMA